MTGRIMPAERPDWCPSCGTAPCSHPMPDPGTPLGYAAAVLGVVLMVLAVAAAGMLLAGTWTP